MSRLNALARRRVRLGFALGAFAFWLARPSKGTWLAGAAIAIVGEVLRIWAAGHLEKGREVTTSGPYRLLRHPLYFGSALMGVGIAIAARSVWVGLIVGIYLGLTLPAAIRTEEATLRARFGDAYDVYRAGRATAIDRHFSLGRAMANHEYRAMAGLVVAMALLALKMR